MEENKNNAVEKVEQTVKELSTPHHEYDNSSKPSELEKFASDMSKQTDKAQIKTEQKLHKKAERQKAKATKKRAKELKKQEKKQANSGNNGKNKKGQAGWIAAVVTLGIATLVLASVLTFNMIMPSAEEDALQDIYNKSFYDTTAEVNNIDVNLSKVLATSDRVAMQSYLTDIAVESELAENNIQQLPMQDENKFYTAKLVNQIGDYAKYLNKKLARGEKLTEQDQEILISLYQANRTLKRALIEVSSQAQGQLDFSKMLSGDKDDSISQSFSKLENLSVSYPELIYDGPFSDGQENRELKGISGEEVTKAEAMKIVESSFAEYNIKSINSAGEVSGNLECYNVTADTQKGMLFAQVSKKGGKLIMFSLAGDCNAVEFTEEHVIETANEFLQSLGLKNMQAVWVNLSGNVYTINFAYSIGDIPVYSDLIKIRVCAQTDTVLGMEAVGYYTNHTERVLPSASLTGAKAKDNVSKNIQIETSRLAVIPVGNSSEKLCYEFMGIYDDATYYVYIDAVTGSQVQMFKVIESTEGKLLI